MASMVMATMKIKISKLKIELAVPRSLYSVLPAGTLGQFEQPCASTTVQPDSLSGHRPALGAGAYASIAIELGAGMRWAPIAYPLLTRISDYCRQTIELDNAGLSLIAIVCRPVSMAQWLQYIEQRSTL